MGYSSQHSSTVPLILNLTSGSISPQYHVVFDDAFSTVISLSVEETPPDFWNDVDLVRYTHQVPLDDNVDPRLPPDWLTSQELEKRAREENSCAENLWGLIIF